MHDIEFQTFPLKCAFTSNQLTSVIETKERHAFTNISAIGSILSTLVGLCLELDCTRKVLPEILIIDKMQ